MGRPRGDQTEYVLDGPEASIASVTGLFSGSQITGKVFVPSEPDLDNELIEDQSQRVGGGAHEPIEGLSYNRNSVPFSTYAEGVGGSGAASTTPTKGFVTKAMSACLQSAGDSTQGDALTGTPTTTSLTETNAGRHDVTASTIGLVLVELDDGTYEWVPYTYSTATLTLLMALSSAPSSGNTVYGCHVIPYVDNWSGAIGYSMAMRGANADASGGADTDWQARGMIGSFGIPAVGASGVPQLDFQFGAAGFDDLTDYSAGTPSGTPGVPMANGEIKIAAYGSTAWTAICVDDIAFNLNRGYEWAECIKRGSNEGISGADDNGGIPELVVTLPPGTAPPAAITSSATKYRTSRRTKGDDYHVLADFGAGGPGKAFAAYLARCILGDVRRTRIGNKIAEQLVFRPKVAMTEPLCHFGQG